MRQCSAECGIVKADEQCTPECQAGCTPAACDALDLASICEDSCTTTCIEEGREPVDGMPSPRYGQQADLNFNIIRVYDGNGQLYLQNTYGTTLSSPDFDTVMAQTFGESTPKLARWDVVAAKDGIATSSLPGWAAAADRPAIAERDRSRHLSVQLPGQPCPRRAARADRRHGPGLRGSPRARARPSGLPGEPHAVDAGLADAGHVLDEHVRRRHREGQPKDLDHELLRDHRDQPPHHA